MNLRIFFLRITKSVFFLSPFWRWFLPIMKFDMSVAQVHFMQQLLLGINGKGAVVEIGVGGGSTSVLLNQFMKNNNINRDFYAIDTFFGFTKEDILVEQNERGKQDNYLYYTSNSRNWYKKTLLANGISNAKIYKADAKKIDYKKIGPLAFCLFDVDLYNPTSVVLPILYEQLIPGGVIIIDDCSPETSIYDGAGQAYREFTKKMNLKEELVLGKLGVLRK